MGALCAHIPGEGVTHSFAEPAPLTRIAQARSDLSPQGRGKERLPQSHRNMHLAP
jgi:hypothetical protein